MVSFKAGNLGDSLGVRAPGMQILGVGDPVVTGRAGNQAVRQEGGRQRLRGLGIYPAKSGLQLRVQLVELVELWAPLPRCLGREMGVSYLTHCRSP